MKKRITLFTMLFVVTLQAQNIIHDLGYEGLNYPSGQTALPIEYDGIKNAGEECENSPIFIYKSIIAPIGISSWPPIISRLIKKQ